MLTDSSQFLHILAAESEHLVTVAVELPAVILHEFESDLNRAFSSDSFGDTAKAWNDQRLQVIREAIEKHLVPVGIKWVREWLRDECQENLAKRCGAQYVAIVPSTSGFNLTSHHHFFSPSTRIV